MWWARHILLLFCGLLATGGSVHAWSAKGHQLITRTALESLSSLDLPWSPGAEAAVVAFSVQPDLMRPREMPGLRRIEAPRHFIDLEMLRGEALPAERFEYLQLLVRLQETQPGRRDRDGDLEDVGTVPYSVVENTQRLAVAFAQVRHRPDDLLLQMQAAHYAGLVAHYAQDLSQPLHTTVHHDGRARSNGSSPGTGIHHQVDSLLLELEEDSLKLPEQKPKFFDPVFPGVLAALDASHSQVDTVYELESDLQAVQRTKRPSPVLQRFAEERFAASVHLTADLIYSAWRLSRTLEMPSWFNATRSRR